MTFFTQGFTYKSASTNIPPQTSHWQPPAVVLPSTPQYDGTLILTIHTYDSADMFSPYLAHYSRNYQMPRRSGLSVASSLPPAEKMSSSHPAFASVLYRSVSDRYPYLRYPYRNRYRKLLYRYKKSDWTLHYTPITSAREAIHSAYCSCPDRQAHYSADKVPYAYHHTHCIPGYQSLHAPDEYL